MNKVTIAAVTAAGILGVGLFTTTVPVTSEGNTITEELIRMIVKQETESLQTKVDTLQAQISQSSSSSSMESSSASSSSASSEIIAPVVEQVQQVAQDVEEIKTQNQSLETRVAAVEQAVSASSASSVAPVLTQAWINYNRRQELFDVVEKRGGKFEKNNKSLRIFASFLYNNNTYYFTMDMGWANTNILLRVFEGEVNPYAPYTSKVLENKQFTTIDEAIAYVNGL